MTDFDDPFPRSAAAEAAHQLEMRERQENDAEMAAILNRVAQNQQSLADVQRLAVELGLNLTFTQPAHVQD